MIAVEVVRPFDGSRWIGLDREMPNQEATAKLEQIMTEADALIRRRLKESRLEVMHVTLAITQETVLESCAPMSGQSF